jgi:hypothetical protein
MLVVGGSSAREQRVYEYDYVYLTNGVVTSFQTSRRTDSAPASGITVACLTPL